MRLQFHDSINHPTKFPRSSGPLKTAYRSNFCVPELNEMGKARVLTKKIGDLVSNGRNANKGRNRSVGGMPHRRTNGLFVSQAV